MLSHLYPRPRTETMALAVGEAGTTEFALACMHAVSGFGDRVPPVLHRLMRPESAWHDSNMLCEDVFSLTATPPQEFPLCTTEETIRACTEQSKPPLFDDAPTGAQGAVIEEDGPTDEQAYKRRVAGFEYALSLHKSGEEARDALVQAHVRAQGHTRHFGSRAMVVTAVALVASMRNPKRQDPQVLDVLSRVLGTEPATLRDRVGSGLGSLRVAGRVVRLLHLL